MIVTSILLAFGSVFIVFIKYIPKFEFSLSMVAAFTEAISWIVGINRYIPLEVFVACVAIWFVFWIVSVIISAILSLF